jgi:hypothetical protein
VERDTERKNSDEIETPEAGDGFYDLKNIFAEKMGGKNWRF